MAQYVRLLVTRLRPDLDGTYALALAEMEVLSASATWPAAEVTALDGLETESWARRKLVDGDVFWHKGGPVQPLTPPLLRREFVLPGCVLRASAYATALGLYELRLNGWRAGDHLLAPECDRLSPARAVPDL